VRALLATALIACLPLGSCGAPEEPRASVEEAWVRLPAVQGRPGAAYFTIRTTNDPTRLVAVTSPRVARIELHQSMTGHSSGMERARDLTFDDGLEFVPGGRHAMLFGLDPALRPGDRIPLTFTFEPLPPVTVEVEVRGAGG
jgi:copper(I)-binding protein